MTPWFRIAVVDRVLHGTSYTEFLSRYADLPNDAVELFIKSMDGYWGVQTHSLSAAEAMQAWLPGSYLLGDIAHRVTGAVESEAVAMFPDGNASIARLLVRSLIPAVAPAANSQNIAAAWFYYAQLDRRGSPVRLRLESTVVRVANVGGEVAVTSERDGSVVRVRARHAVLARYHANIPSLCPEIPEAQKAAQRYQVKHPMLLTNVLVRSREALDRLGISGADTPTIISICGTLNGNRRGRRMRSRGSGAWVNGSWPPAGRERRVIDGSDR